MFKLPRSVHMPPWFVAALLATIPPCSVAQTLSASKPAESGSSQPSTPLFVWTQLTRLRPSTPTTHSALQSTSSPTTWWTKSTRNRPSREKDSLPDPNGPPAASWKTLSPANDGAVATEMASERNATLLGKSRTVGRGVLQFRVLYNSRLERTAADIFIGSTPCF